VYIVIILTWVAIDVNWKPFETEPQSPVPFLPKLIWFVHVAPRHVWTGSNGMRSNIKAVSLLK